MYTERKGKEVKPAHRRNKESGWPGPAIFLGEGHKPLYETN